MGRQPIGKSNLLLIYEIYIFICNVKKDGNDVGRNNGCDNNRMNLIRFICIKNNYCRVYNRKLNIWS